MSRYKKHIEDVLGFHYGMICENGIAKDEHTFEIKALKDKIKGLDVEVRELERVAELQWQRLNNHDELLRRVEEREVKEEKLVGKICQCANCGCLYIVHKGWFDQVRPWLKFCSKECLVKIRGGWYD